MASKTVGIMQLVEPEFLSLVKTPANQTGFKIIRSTQDNTKMAHTDRNLRVRNKQKRADGLLSVDFPEGLTEEEAREMMDAFALGDDYELSTTDVGTYYAKRTGDSTGVSNGVRIDLGNGYSATIDKSIAATRSDNAIVGVTLVGFEFDETFESVDSIKEWLGDREINFTEESIESLEGGTIVTRHVTPAGEVPRKVKLADGVVGIVSKTADTDVPDMVYRTVIEQSYGNWGWGHLNFATALADPAFTDQSWDAIYVLRDVLENVVIYSGLPLDDRKVLIQNVCEQFTQYMTSLIDSLPREVIEQARKDRKQTKRHDDMAMNKKDTKKKKVETTDDKTVEDTTTTDTAGKDVTRSDSDDSADGTDGTDDDTNAGTEDTAEFVTRSELKSLVTEAMQEALAPEKEKTKRSDEEETESDMSIMAKAMTTMGDAMAKITRSVEDVKGDIDVLNGATTTRSDGDDAAAEEEGDAAEKAKRADASPFDGMFGDRFQ